MNESVTDERVELRGSVYAEFRMEVRLALSLATEGWTDDEKQALLNGHKEARAALEQELLDEILRGGGPDEIDCEYLQVKIASPEEET